MAEDCRRAVALVPGCGGRTQSVPRPAMTTYAPSWPCPQQANRTPGSLAMHGSSPSGVRACRHKLHTVRPLSSMTQPLRPSPLCVPPELGRARKAVAASGTRPTPSVPPSACFRLLPRRARRATGTQSLSQRTYCTPPSPRGRQAGARAFSAGSHPRSRGAATSSARSRRRCEPSPAAGASGRGVVAANLGHDADTTAAVYGSSRAPTTAREGSPRSGGRGSRSSGRSRASLTGCTTPPGGSPLGALRVDHLRTWGEWSPRLDNLGTLVRAQYRPFHTGCAETA